MTIPEVQDRISTLLRAAGARHYTAEEARDDARNVWRDVCKDNLEHGDSPEKPFWNFTISDGVVVFVVYDAIVRIYVFAADEQEVVESFDPIAMGDVPSAVAVLRRKWARSAPDLVLDGPLATQWLAEP